MEDFKIWLGDCTEEVKFQVLQELEARGVEWAHGEALTKYTPPVTWNYLVRNQRRYGPGMFYGGERETYDWHDVEELDVSSLLTTCRYFSVEEFMDMIGGE